MKYYAKYSFERKPGTETVYLFKSKLGHVVNLELAEHKDGSKYIQFEIPREESIKKYFSHVFTGKDHKTITSTESLDYKKRTFGDTKKLGTRDLILIQFSNDMNTLDMYFVSDKGNCRTEKQEAFKQWCNFLDNQAW